jgi:hypothetical protein
MASPGGETVSTQITDLPRNTSYPPAYLLTGERPSHVDNHGQQLDLRHSWSSQVTIPADPALGAGVARLIPSHPCHTNRGHCNALGQSFVRLFTWWSTRFAASMES